MGDVVHFGCRDDDEIIERAQEIIQLARDGKIAGLAVAVVKSDGSYGIRTIHDGCDLTLIGVVRMVEKMLTEDHEAKA